MFREILVYVVILKIKRKKEEKWRDGGWRKSVWGRGCF